MRLLTFGSLTGLLYLAACGTSDPAAPGPGGGSAGGPVSGAGAPVSSSAGSPPVASSGGSANSGSSGVHAGAGGAGTGPAQAAGAGTVVDNAGRGGNDDGGLFSGNGIVPVMLSGGAPSTGGGPSFGGSGPGNSGRGIAHIGGSASGTATFTTGADGSVTVVVSLTSCPSGTIGIFVMNGDSCDNTGTEGTAWDGKRGNIGDTGALSCNNGKASLMYTRPKTDPAVAWSVGDHNFVTDVTAHVVIVTSSSSVTSSHIGCGNFFS